MTIGYETPKKHSGEIRQALEDRAKLVPEMIPLKEASFRTGLSYDFLRKLCLTGKIVHIRAGSKYLVNFGKLCEYLNTEGKNR